MSLSSVMNDLADDVADAATPLASRWFAGPRRIALADGDGLAVYEVSRDGQARPVPETSPVGRRRGGPAQGELRLPAASVLTRTLSFPAATRDYLEPVLDNRLERLTPWAPERVIYGYRAEDDVGDGQLSVRFVATARDVVDVWTARAAAIGFTPTALGSAAEPLGEPLAIDLWRGQADPFRRSVRRGLAIAAVAVAAVVLPLCGWSFWTLHVSQTRLAEVEARSGAARDALRRVAGGGTREAELIGEKKPDTAIMTLVDRLASALPDGSVLRELEIDPQRIRLAGASNAAPELIGLLEASGAVAGARFGAPVTRNADGRDGFEILADRVAAAPAAGTKQP